MNGLYFNFTIDEVNTILRHLDAGAHAQVRQLIDKIISETGAQQQASTPASTSASALEGGEESAS
jgi:hypothetical protein